MPVKKLSEVAMRLYVKKIEVSSILSNQETESVLARQVISTALCQHCRDTSDYIWVFFGLWVKQIYHPLAYFTTIVVAGANFVS